eukprot:13301869-Ditylum_brightwellii.AAC.1
MQSFGVEIEMLLYEDEVYNSSVLSQNLKEYKVTYVQVHWYLPYAFLSSSEDGDWQWLPSPEATLAGSTNYTHSTILSIIKSFHHQL